MPANIAHMLIAYKTLHRIQAAGHAGLKKMARLFLSRKYRSFVNLGSISPDLFYYASIAGEILGNIFDSGTVKACGVEPWSYHMHSVCPNAYPLNLIQVVFKDTLRPMEPGPPSIDISLRTKELDPVVARLAFIAGHLFHMGADQIIHPIVNQVAGPYYVSRHNREEHRTCEVYQDVFLYNHVYWLEGKRDSEEYHFFNQHFNIWADIGKSGSSKNTEDWFKYFIQRGFAETYNQFPDEKVIESSVDNLLLILRGMTRLGPYKKAEDEYDAFVIKNQKSENFMKYFENIDYLKFYREAIELSALYMIALYEVYDRLKSGEDFTEDHYNRFLSIVSSADLSCPLERDILKKAIEAYQGEIAKGLDYDPRTLTKGVRLYSKEELQGFDEIQLVDFS